MAFGHHYNRHVERTITDEFAFLGGKKKKKFSFESIFNMNSFRRKINTRFKTGIDENRKERKHRKYTNTLDEEDIHMTMMLGKKRRPRIRGRTS